MELGLFPDYGFTRFQTAMQNNGKQVKWVRLYPQPATSCTAAQIQSAMSTYTSQGIKCYVSFKTTFSWDQVAAGSDDARWTSIGNMLAGVSPAGAWCFWHEPENDPPAGQYGSSTYGDSFRAATDHIASIIKPLAPAWLNAPCLFEEVFPHWAVAFGSRGSNWVTTPDPNRWIPDSSDVLGVDYYAFRGGNDSIVWAPTHSRTISNATWSNGVATFTTSTTHSNRAGVAVQVTGVTPSGYNGLYEIISIPTTTTFTVALASNPGAYSSGGSMVSGNNVWPTAQPAIDEFITYAQGKGISQIFFPEFGAMVADPAILNENAQRAKWFQGISDLYHGDARILGNTYFEVNNRDNAARGNYSITDFTQPPTDPATVTAFASMADPAAPSGQAQIVTSFASSTDAATYSSPAGTPATNQLLVAFVGAQRSTSDPVTPTVVNAPWGLTWTRDTRGDNLWTTSGAATNRKGWIFVAKTGGSAPGSDTFDLDFGGTTHIGCEAIVVQINNIDLTGSALAAVVQCAVNSGTVAGYSTTLSAASSPNNRALAFYEHNTDSTTAGITAEAGWSELGEISHTTPTITASANFLATGFDTSPSATSSTGTNFLWGAWGLELKAPVSVVTNQKIQIADALVKKTTTKSQSADVVIPGGVTTLTFVHKDDGSTTTAPFTSNSIAFQNNKLYLVAIAGAGPSNTITSVAGGGITWANVRESHALNESIGLWVGYVTTGASTGALSFGGTGTINRVNWSVEEVDGSTATSGGTNAIIQTGFEPVTGAQTSSSVTLAAFEDISRNAVYSWVYVHLSAITITPEAGYTTLLANAGSGISTMAAYRIGQDTTVTSSWTTSAGVLAIAAEIESATAITTVTKTQTADSFVRKTITKTQTADAAVKKSFTRTQTVDSVVKKTTTKTQDVDAIASKTLTLSQSADAVRKVSGITKTQTADAVRFKSFTKTQGTSVVITNPAPPRTVSDWSGSVQATTSILQTVARSQTASAVVKVSGTTRTQTADVRVQKTATRTQTADAVVKKTGPLRTQSIDSFLSFRTIRSSSTDAVVKISGTTLAQSTDVRITKTSLKTQGTSVDIAKTVNKSQTADTSISKTAITKTQSADAFALKSSTKVQTADTRITSHFATTQGADGFLSAPVRNLVVTVLSDTSIRLDWTAAPGVTGYDVERNGVVIAWRITPNTFTDTGLSPNTTYTYRVRALIG